MSAASKEIISIDSDLIQEAEYKELRQKGFGIRPYASGGEPKALVPQWAYIAGSTDTEAKAPQHHPSSRAFRFNCNIGTW